MNRTVSWHATRARLSGTQPGECLEFFRDGVAMSFADILAGWTSNAEFRIFTIEALGATPFEAFFWEMPPIRLTSLDRAYECVVLDSPDLRESSPDPTAFSDQFRSGGTDQIVTFSNLRGDAMLVVPRPLAEASAYTHVARFFRFAPRAQQDELLRVLGTVVPTMLSDRPLWLSTAGLGVAWLHVRLDSRPKYYRFDRYRDDVRI